MEDCFQATFFVLVRKAASIRRRGLVGNWLYGVARSAALKARAMRNLRHKKEKEAGAEKVRKSADHDQVAEVADTSATLQELLDEELQVLPDKYRAAIVLCDLEGLTIVAAAKQLGCPQGTLSTGLSEDGPCWPNGCRVTVLRCPVPCWQRLSARMQPRLVCRARWWFLQFKPPR